MLIVILTILILIIVALIIYNITIQSKIKKFQNTNQRIKNLAIVQDFMNTIGEESSVDAKIKKINNLILEKYQIQYSTIVIFDGAEYVVKASNVEEKHWDSLRSLQEDENFIDSIQTASPKYVSINREDEKLSYQQTEFGRAKSAIFFPLYFDNVYIGYWIIESGVPHGFDNIDTSILEVVKDNIVSVLKTVAHQNTLESIVRTDEFSGLKSEEYLYGEGKKVVDQFTKSTICMFNIVNLKEINKKYSRELGNKVITDISNYLKENIAENYIFIRYAGPKFVIAFSGAEISGVADFLNDIKDAIESMNISLENNEQQSVNPKLNFVVSYYYKGTGMEEILRKLENYLDSTDPEESEINNI